MNVVVDTSVWIDFFAGKASAALESALQDGVVVLPPIVIAELLSGVHKPRQVQKLEAFLSELPVHPTPREHWNAVGRMRRLLQQRGVSMSTPDAHVAQSALDLGALLLTRDRVFSTVQRMIGLRLG